ncbi:hypothetical protein PVIIG_05999 [Plasmodium vivax India VII]|uniref:VIR protein n=1 Tax=Plasmodium vivax India VII TaxID=1077284 RepID=A0A0J9V0K0_PLAVI|nr:hypothetical protein PVIIG_05999 [Plasmodium vivax India VII]
MAEHGLGELPSKVFYNSLNNSKKDNTYSIDCANVGNGISEQKKINEICNKLGQNIYYLENDHKHRLLFFDKHCYDLNYLLYDEVTKELGKGNTTTNIYPFFEKIQKQWEKIDRSGNSNDSDKICMPESQLFKTGLFKHMKKLLDYFENFENIKKELETPNDEHKKYCDYILKSVPLYFTFQQLCNLIKNDICIKYLEIDDRYNPKELLSKLACVEGGTYKVELDHGLITEMIKTYSSGIGNMLPGFSNFLPGNLQGMFMNSIYDLMQQGFKNSGLETLYNKIKSYTNIFYSEDFQTYGIPSLFALGCLIFLFIIYKVKSKYILKHRRKKRRKRLSDLDTSELMSAPLGFPSPMLPMNPYGLRYQPM